MKRLLSLVSAFAFSASASATVITFESGLDPAFDYDGVTIQTTSSTVNNGYKTMADHTGSTNFLFSPTGATNPATISLKGSGTFDLNSLDAVGAWGTQTLTLFGIENNTNKYFVKQTINNKTVTNIKLNWIGIDAIRIFAGTDFVLDPALNGMGTGTNWIVDNFSINQASNAVPESSSLALLGLGLLGFVAVRKKQLALNK